MRYLVKHGDDDPLYLDGFHMAQTFMATSIKDLRASGQLQGWRAEALMNQVENMPRAGFSFTTKDGTLIGVEKA